MHAFTHECMCAYGCMRACMLTACLHAQKNWVFVPEVFASYKYVDICLLSYEYVSLPPNPQDPAHEWLNGT